MSYDTIQAAVYDLTLAYGGGVTLTADNAKIEDWTVLDARGTDISAIVWMAGDTQEADSFDGHAEYGKRQAMHEIGVTVATKIKTGRDSEAKALLASTVADLADYLRARPVLGGAEGVRYSEIIRITRRMGINRTREANSATHWASTIVLRVFEEFPHGWVEAGQ